MQSIVGTWQGLELGKRVTLAGAVVAMILALFFLLRIATQPSMSLLYSGLESATAGEVVTALDSQGVSYEIRGNSVYVDAAARDQLRLTLAAQGLPANSAQGYELLDNLTGFGTTSQMFDAAYLRAKEGELARTIVANPRIKAARVHLARAQSSPFQKASSATASVSIQSNGAPIGMEAAQSIRFLVAAAVAGLAPEDVSVIDADLGVLLDRSNEADPSKSAQDRALALKQNVERLIQARTGLGNAIVEVNVETLSEDELIVERRFDPDGRVIISTETTEKSSSSQNAGAADVTVASNLPAGDAGATNRDSSAQDTDTREIVNYEVSETKREIHRVAGSIKRISVAVLVDGNTTVGDDGSASWSPRSEDELNSLEALVKSAVGFDAERGDVVTIRSMDLASANAALPIEDSSWITGRGFDVLALTKTTLLGIVILALGFFVVKPILMNSTALANENSLLDTSAGITPLVDDILTPSESMAGESGDQSAIGLGEGNVSDPQVTNPDPVARLKSLIEERQEETIAVLRNWVEGPRGATDP